MRPRQGGPPGAGGERPTGGKPPGSSGERSRAFGFRPLDLGLLAAGVLTIVVGYWRLDAGSVTLAPLLLVAGYVILIPAGLLAGIRRRDPGDAGE